MTTTELKKVLDKHKLWHAGGSAALRADLRGADLMGAYLTGADLRGADLRGADLAGADLTGADLAGADLTDADLRGAVLTDADLTDADLTDADLRGAVLTDAVLTRAVLTRAVLTRAVLTDADLTGADLTIKQVPHLVILPEGKLTVYKKLRNGIVATLEIPEHALRVNSTKRKCRCSEARVLALSEKVKEGVSMHDNSFIYRVGETVKPDSFNPDFRVTCSSGIHFFITKQEAEQYD